MNTKTLTLSAFLLTLPFGLSCASNYPAGGGSSHPRVYTLIDETARQQPAAVAAESAPTPAETASPPEPAPSPEQAAPAPVAPASLPADTAEVASTPPTPAAEQVSAGPSLTEALDRTLDLLANEKAQNEKLTEELQSAKMQVEEKDRTIKDLQLQLETCTAKSGELQKTLDDDMVKWKDDVLGFRDEMRTAQEAEIEVLQQILLLLKDFKAEKASK